MEHPLIDIFFFQVRRLQRGVKTLEGLLRTAKAGRPVKEDDIPPPVATGQQAGSTASAASTSQNVLSSSPKPLPVESFSPKTPPSSKVSSGVPTPLVQVAPVSPVSPKVESKPVDSKTVQLLEARQHEYRDAALAAKKSGNKEEALKYFRMLKVTIFIYSELCQNILTCRLLSCHSELVHSIPLVRGFSLYARFCFFFSCRVARFS